MNATDTQPRTTARKPRTRRPHTRTVRVLITPTPGGSPLTLIRITQDGEPSHYWVEPMPSDYGLAYRLERDGTEATGEQGRDAYDVLLDAEGASCTCPGHNYGGYCRHADAVAVLHAQGRLPLPPVANVVHGDDCPCEGCRQLAEYKPAGANHGLPF